MKFTFKGKEDYSNQRTALINQATELINDGKLDDAQAVQEDIKLMDSEWGAYAQALADIAALENSNPVKDIKSLNTPQIAGQIAGKLGNGASDDEDFTNSREYRVAFMNMVMKDTPIPANLMNADANTKTSDVTSVIPTTLVEQIIQKLDSIGKIYEKITKTNLQGGVSYPIADLLPVATWVDEGQGSDRQKGETGSITFAWHKLRCAISVSLETDTMTLAIFESKFVEAVSKAMIKKIEEAVFNGTGVKQPKGILLETPEDGQALKVANKGKIDWQLLNDCEAAVPEEYDADAEWYMSKKTFYSDINGMVDQNGQPIARVNIGPDGKPEPVILGRKVNFTNYLPKFNNNPTQDTIFAFIFRMSDYILNENLKITIKKYEDNETDDQVTKAIALVDGKCAVPYSLVTLSSTKAQ